jgi:acetyltransferase-like isoleucine patch superfamily enzyme
MGTKDEQVVPRSLEKFNFSRSQQVALLCCNYIPFLHVLLMVVTLCVPWATLGWRVGAAVTMLYILPPVLARLLLLLWPIRSTHIAIPSRDYFVWWSIFHLQVLFSRLPALEELMRVVPGLYSLWLRLWGSRIGSFTYWAVGLRILDRSFLEIGNSVAFGAGVRLNPHVIAKTDEGKMELILAPVRIGDRAIIGGYALLTAGTHIADDEVTRACLLSPPFSHWKGGKRIEKGVAGKGLENSEP